MKFAEALEIIGGKQLGFMVHFEHAGDGFLRSDYFPDKHAGEDLIDTEDAAWELARLFAAQTKEKCVNIYVVNQDFSSVENYDQKKIKNR